MHVSRCQAGTYTGTGAVQAITLGFKPAAVIIINTVDTDECFLAIDGMTAEYGVLLANGTYADNQGVTFGARGFSPAAELSVSTEGYVYLAIG